jgi:hypothetical protein
MKSGIVGVGKSVLGGLSGMVTQPVRGAREEGTSVRAWLLV